MKIFGLRLNQITLASAAIGILFSLPRFATWGVWLWLTASLFLLLGVMFLLLNK